MSKLIHIRKDHPALRYGDFLTLQADKNVYAFVRSDMNERILVVLNKSENEQVIDLKLPEYYNLRTATDLVTGNNFTINENIISFNVKGIGFRILKLN